MKINKTGYILLNLILLASIVVGFYELVDIKTLVSVFITPAFIVSAFIRYNGKKKEV